MGTSSVVYQSDFSADQKAGKTFFFEEARNF